MSTNPGFYSVAQLDKTTSWFNLFEWELKNRNSIFAEQTEQQLEILYPNISKKDVLNLQKWRKKQLELADYISKLLQREKLYKVSMLDKALHELPQWDTPQQYWLQGTKLCLPVEEGELLLIDFSLEEPCALNIGSISTVLWGALVYRDKNSVFIQPLGGQYKHSGFFCYFPTLCTDVKNPKAEPSCLMQRTPSDGEFGLLSTPNAIMMAKWSGLGMSQFIISFLYEGSTILLNQ